MLPRDAHIVITDSGLGGLSICAAARTRAARRRPVPRHPPHVRERVAIRGSRLQRSARRGRPRPGVRRGPRADGADAAGPDPDRLQHAVDSLPADGVQPSTVGARCTASSMPAWTSSSSASRGDTASSIVLLGTKTTIESGVHKAQLEQRGIDPRRIAAVSCHGLAGAIERDVDGPRAAELIGECAARAVEAAPRGTTLLLGLCCTHYGYVAVRLADAVARLTSRRVDVAQSEPWPGRPPARGCQFRRRQC